MKASKIKFKTERIKDEQLETTDLLEKAGYIKKMSSGLYVYLNLGQRVLGNINKIIREEFESESMLEIGLNQLQSADLWKTSGRYNELTEMYKFTDRSDNDMLISGTNEELITSVSKSYIESYKDLSFTWFAINNKFRDEIRCNNGLERCKEFIMMDAYSFNRDKEDLAKSYDMVRESYKRIFDRLGLDYTIVSADTGDMGGSLSEEFIVNDIEIGHIFQLDDKYTESFGVTYVDESNKKQNVLMGCYGIGVSRILAVLADAGRLDNYLNFNSAVSAYEYEIVVVDSKKEGQAEFAEKIYKDLLSKGKTVLLDDRKIKVGRKLHDADLVGINKKILVGRGYVNGEYEIKEGLGDWTTIQY